MNNKPVAWMDENENVIFEKNWAYPIPLYTHPVKELTDSEITEVFDKCFPTNASSDVIPLVEFARAILIKAQEK